MEVDGETLPPGSLIIELRPTWKVRDSELLAALEEPQKSDLRAQEAEHAVERLWISRARTAHRQFESKP